MQMTGKSLWLLSLVLMCGGCDKPAQTQGATPPGGQPPGQAAPVAGAPGQPATSAAPGSAQAGQPAAGQPAAAPAAEACTVQLDALPTSFFTHRMILSLPRGLKLVEQNPYFARAETANQTASCGGTVTFAALGYVRAGGSGEELRTHILALRGLPEGSYTWEQPSSSRQYDGIYNVPAGEKGEPALKGWMHTEDLGGVMFFVFFETSPEGWAILEPSFRASTAELKVRAVTKYAEER